MSNTFNFYYNWLFISNFQTLRPGSAAVAVTLSCKYAVTATATSSIIEIEPSAGSNAVLDKIGSLDDGLELNYYTDDTYKNPMTGPATIGDTVYPMVSWKVESLQGKMGFYIKTPFFYWTYPKFGNMAMFRSANVSHVQLFFVSANFF